MNEECLAYNIFFFHQHHLAVNGEVEQKKENLPHKHRISTFLNDNNYKHEK